MDGSPINLNKHPLPKPKVMAIATDKYLSPKVVFADPNHLPSSIKPQYGQDISYAYRKSTPRGYQVGTSINDLKLKMRKLINIFAEGDQNGLAIQLFDDFLQKQPQVEFFSDTALNNTAKNHKNIKTFMSKAISAPNSPQKTAGKIRIHQALKRAGWDINKIIIPTDLGVPAFNLGSKVFTTQDFDNGLGLMINGVQHVYVIATHYFHDKKNHKYHIRLKFLFYDVFGLDDEDLLEYGAKSDNWTASIASVGITAWWQLQHQHAFAPLVTRIVIEQDLEVPTI